MLRSGAGGPRGQKAGAIGHTSALLGPGLVAGHRPVNKGTLRFYAKVQGH